jgi:hypothetical protein
MHDGEPNGNDKSERLNFLEQRYLDIALTGDEHGLTVDTEYFRRGGSIRSCLTEIEQLAGRTELERDIDDAREGYMAVVLTRPTLRNRHERKARLLAAEVTYIDAVVNKLTQIVDAQSPDEMLKARQVPSLVEKTSFNSDRPIPLKDLAANHLFVLMDTALQEHAHRRQLIQEQQTASLRARVVGNRVLHVGIAAGIFAAAFVPELGVVPTPDEFITHDIETTLKVISAGILGLDVPELIRLQLLQRKHDAQTKKLNRQLAANQELSDMALRVSYGSPRYGSSNGPHQFTDRYGTTDPTENVRRLELTDSSFEDLHSDPGGRPYTGSQAIGYATRFLIERTEQVKLLADDPTENGARRDQYLQLCRDILLEDVTRMKKGLTVVHYRKEIMKVIGIVPAVLFPTYLAGASEAKTATSDVSRTMGPANGKHQTSADCS